MRLIHQRLVEQCSDCFAHFTVVSEQPLTSVGELVAFRDLIESIKLDVARRFRETSWLKQSRDLLRLLDHLTEITPALINLPETVYDKQNYSSLMASFSGFIGLPDETTIYDKILRLRKSNFLFAAHRIEQPSFDFDALYISAKKQLAFYPRLLLPPMFHVQYPISYKYGLLGSIIGHETFHAFTQNAHTPVYLYQHAEFNRSLECFGRFYGETFCYNSPSEKICLNSQETMEENVPDVEGARASYRAMEEKMATLSAEDQWKKERPLIEYGLDLNNEQLFFVAQTQYHCDNRYDRDPKFLADELQSTSIHAPGKIRVNAMAMQSKEFADAFQCKSGSEMTKVKDEDKCYTFS